jgi:membrane-associated phospholipid phosphatase
MVSRTANAKIDIAPTKFLLRREGETNRQPASLLVQGSMPLSRLHCIAPIVLVFASGVAVAQNDQQPPAAAPDSRDRVYYPGDTESFKPLAHKLLSNVLLDQKDIWTSPFHMHGDDALLWIGFTGATAALIATDHQTSTIFENSKGQVTWGNNISKIGAAYTLIPLTAGFYAFGVLVDDPKARETGVLGAEALIDGLIVYEVLKPIAGRNRPNSNSEKQEFFEGGGSFPSGHAVESWALAAVIGSEYGHTIWVPIVAYGLATVVSTARFAAQQHYASDVFAGAAIGWFIGHHVYKTHRDHEIHHHSWLDPRIMPQVAPGSHTYGVSLVFGQ